MQFYKAQIADILRCNQRDEAFISDLESQLHSFLKYINSRSYHRIRQSIPLIANVWYYYMTSLSNLQTLGEEYAGIIRITKNNKIPSTLIQILWLVLHIGGEPLFDRALIAAEKQINRSVSLTSNAKEEIIITSLIDLQESVMYCSGTGCKTIHSQEVLISLDMKTTSLVVASSKYCVLCTENIKGPTSTPCGHIFCWDCIQDSLSYQKNCPIWIIGEDSILN
ncbi:hypothetical protein GWI33_014483 [Rhynchophorus ferrugineus]|uniref:RING-type E3 ubiquitin transferase n=1 Tax=Rhynchophorus ferrugineus TaxID=354439 RepID=A0A834MCB5_RHYFE|nr:hypothetical protein GWI33_014483 [Rhynchophorus ferrugineus]